MDLPPPRPAQEAAATTATAASGEDGAPAPPPPPFLLHRPERQVAPIVLASPHSGRDYPPDLLNDTRLDALALRRSEDGFVDELFADAPALGLPLLAATFPRVYCDANREPWELDPGMFDGPLPDWVNTASPRVGAGLGTIARVVATGEPVYGRRLRFEEAADRVRRLWRPYHDALAGLIAETVAAFGCCLLLDCHSMPSAATAGPGATGNGASRGGGSGPDFVLGDAHGTACAPRATRAAEAALVALGYAVRRNDPYAGGYVTRHYGRPREGIHALQVEVSRGLYMDERSIRPLPNGLPRLRGDIARLLGTLAAEDWSALRP